MAMIIVKTNAPPPAARHLRRRAYRGRAGPHPGSCRARGPAARLAQRRAPRQRPSARRRPMPGRPPCLRR